MASPIGRRPAAVQRSVFAWVVLVAPCIAAQEVELRQPMARACTLQALREATPARWEWAQWVQAGASRLAGQDAGASAGVGAVLTTGVLQYPGFPSGPYGQRLGLAELRAGPWLAGVTRSEGGLVEAGAALQLGALYHASFGGWEARAGAGWGAFEHGRSPHLTLALAYGVYSAPARHSKRGFCDPRPLARAIGMASVARLVLTVRRAMSEVPGSELSLGVELSPTFLLPPYGVQRWLGGHPGE